MKKSPEEQSRLTQRRKGPNGGEYRKGFSFAILCGLAPLREVVVVLTPSEE